MNISQILEVFQAGKVVANPESWKKHTVNINILLVLISGILAILHFFDCSFCQFDLTPEQQMNIATGIMAFAGIFNAGSTVVSSDKIGIAPKNAVPVDQTLSNDIRDLQ